jgi:hypothetical protein
VIQKIIIYPNSKNPPRIFKYEPISDEWSLRAVYKILDECWCNIPKGKMYDLLYIAPQDFAIKEGKNRQVVVPKYHLYNIVEMINFVNWVQYESIFYYTGLPRILERQIELFWSIVKLKIGNYKYYEHPSVYKTYPHSNH